MKERCQRPTCGRRLKDPASRERGYGPVCWRREVDDRRRRFQTGGPYPVDPDQIPLPLEDPMSIYPEIVAGYHAAKAALSGMNVTVDHPGTRVAPNYDDPIALVGSFPAAYTVQAMVLAHGINLQRTGRFGMGGEFVLVEYPCPTDAADFEDQLRRVLVPKVQELQEKADAERREQTTADPGGTHEARDAIKRIS